MIVPQKSDSNITAAISILQAAGPPSVSLRWAVEFVARRSSEGPNSQVVISIDDEMEAYASGEGHFLRSSEEAEVLDIVNDNEWRISRAVGGF